MRWLALVVVAGCARDIPQAWFVSDAKVAGTSLLVTRCWVTAHDDELRLRQCRTDAQALPVIAVSTELPAKLDKAQVEAAIAAAKPALDRCVADLAIAKPMRLHVDVAGGVANVSADVAVLATCATAAFATTTFPPTAAPTSFAFELGPSGGVGGS